MRVLASAFLGSLLLAVTPGIAHAHADVVRTSPPNGSVVAKPPDAVSVTFSEKVELVAAMLRGAAAQEIPSRADVSGDRLVITPTATLDGQRSVTASWTVASDDGHRVSGSSAFLIGRSAPVGSRIALGTMPSVPAVLTSNRRGVTSVVLRKPVSAGEVQWTSPELIEPMTWPVVPGRRSAVARGVLPWPGRWTMNATLVDRQGAVMVVTAQVAVVP